MAKGFNKVILMGNLTRDPETRTTPSGQSVTNFSIAVNRNWKDQSGQLQEQVSFFNCVAWARMGETIAQYLTKGSPILVSGRLDQRSWEDKESGQKRSTIEVVVEDFNFVGGGRGDGDASASAAAKPAKKAATEDVAPDDMEEIDLSDIPF
ncbi:MAG: single-stranded DNA-binding protein [Candidatus Nanosyncoccaceae bacterium]|jgi:single-strand DNA-binding protein